MSYFRSLLKRLFCRDLAEPPLRSPLEIEVAALPFAVVNGVALTEKELEERVARHKEPFKQQRPVEQQSPCHTLKLIGYWALPPDWLWPESYKNEQPPWPDVRRVVRPNWRVAERKQLVAYLRHGHRFRGYLGFSTCRFQCHATYSILGSGECTDGEWVWPEGLPHYVERHAVMLPEAFVASASGREWKVPPLDHVAAKVPWVLYYSGQSFDPVAARGRCTVDHTFWLEWAKGLPELSEVPPPPDPAALERGCLVLQYGEDSFDEQVEAFEVNVWDKILEQYGRGAPGIGDEQYIAWIPVKQWDTVVTLVLDGLRRYQVKDRVTVIWSAADPDDWQRDRDVTVWPESAATEPVAPVDPDHL